MNNIRMKGNTLAYDELTKYKSIRQPSGTSFSELNQKMRSAKQLVIGSDCPTVVYKNLLEDALNSANKIDYEPDTSARKVLSELVIETLQSKGAVMRSEGMIKSVEDQIIKAFSNQPDVVQILSADTGNAKDIWLIVEDALSETALEYNDMYFELLSDEEYFEFRVLDTYDLESLDHIKTTCLFRKDNCNAEH